MTRIKAIAATTVAMSLMASTATWAFCGFYVATENSKLTNRASKVVLVRDGDKTAITMASDVGGDQKQFALVIPVPTTIKREQVRVVQPETVEQLQQYSKPRLVEYYDTTPCPDANPSPPAAPIAQAPARAQGPIDNSFVHVEAAFSVEEYDIQVLASDQADALIPWLNRNGYKIPPEAGPVIQSYIGQGMKFFVAKVNLDRAKQENRSGMLRPIQVSYQSRKFMLPIRLGTVNATGPQDMLMMAITKHGRVETTNYQTSKMPTDIDVPMYVKDNFNRFYDATFENSVRKKGGSGVFQEYAWEIPTLFNVDYPQGVFCDPCTSPLLKRSEMQELGVGWTTDVREGGVPRDKAFLTRLHIRYDRASFPEDLQLQETRDDKPFQARYVTHHHEIAFKDLQCYAGYRYASTERPRMWAEEAKNAIELTGWDKRVVANAMSEQWKRDQRD